MQDEVARARHFTEEPPKTFRDQRTRPRRITLPALSRFRVSEWCDGGGFLVCCLDVLVSEPYVGIAVRAATVMR